MKTKQIIFGLFVCPIFLSCGGGEKSAETKTSSDSTKTEVQEVAGLKEFSDIDALAKNNSFTADQFNWITTFLYQKEATITGFPNAYPADTEVEFKPNSSIMLDAEDNSIGKVKVQIKFATETEPRMLKKGEKFAVHGKLSVNYTVSEKWGNETQITIYDAEFVTLEPEQSISSIGDIDLSKPLFSADLFKVMNTHFEALFSKPSIEITGEYVQTSTSTVSSGVYTVIKLGPKTVDCEVIKAPNDGDLVAKRSANELITITGKFAGVTYTPKINQGIIK